jgi:hypothetical protein
MATAAGARLAAAQGHEPTPALRASELLPAALIKGPKHEVAATVKADGFLVAFEVKSTYGTWAAGDREMLELRVAEVYALDKLSEVSKTEIFAKAFGAAAEKKARAVAGVVTDPVGTAKAIPGAVARFGKGLGRVGKKTYDKATTDKPGSGTQTAEQKAKAAASAAGGAAESLLISGKRREWAGKVGADPYTTNETLAAKLDEVGWTAYAGGFALSFAVPSVPGLGTVETADQLIYDLPPGELEKRNLDKLAASGVDEKARQKLILNSNFTPTLQTELVEALVALGAATGKSAVVLLAAESESEGDARYIRRCVQLLAAGASEVGGWKSLDVTSNEIEAVSAEGRLVLPWSVDYLTWNANAVPVDSPAVKAAPAREIWLSGVATARARHELDARGFKVVEARPRKNARAGAWAATRRAFMARRPWPFRNRAGASGRAARLRIGVDLRRALRRGLRWPVHRPRPHRAAAAAANPRRPGMGPRGGTAAVAGSALARPHVRAGRAERRPSYLKIPTAFRMKISRAAPSTATTQPTMGPEADSPSTPASQKPRAEPTMPTTMLAMAPICAFVFMTMLASQPTTAPTISVTIQFMRSPP